MIFSHIKIYINRNSTLVKHLLFLVLLFLLGRQISAQGGGSRSMLPSPTGLWGVDVRWMNLQQNIAPAGNILIPGADLKINVFPITLFHTFKLGGQFAQVFAMISPGSASGDIIGVPIPVPDREASGFSDGFVGFKIGILNAAAYNVLEFAQKQQGFSMSLQLRTWFSGSYYAKKAINMGSNRTTFDLGLPMSLPFGKNKKLPWWFETMPSVEVYTSNNDPFYLPSTTPVEKTRQKALFVLENHLTKTFSPKIWAGVGIRYQNGGKLVRDDVPQLDSRLDILGMGFGGGYQILKPLTLKASYAWTITGYNGAKSNMIRIGAVFAYVDIKKAKAANNN